MSKKKKADHKKKPGQGRSLFPIKDLTAERHYQSQITKARKLGVEGNYYEVLALLYPMREKYADKPELFELLGLSYVNIKALDLARSNFEKAVELQLASSKKPSDHLRFQLASLYLSTGFPALAYEQMQLVDGEEMRLWTNNKIGPKERRQFIDNCFEMMDKEANKHGWSREQFLNYEFPLERGKLALDKDEPATARAYLLEASALDPGAIEPYNNLSASYVLEGDIENAVKQADYVLDKIDPDNILTLSAAVRILVLDSQVERARKYLDRLATLPRPADLEDLLKMATAWAFFEEDQKVFDLIQPLVDSPEQMQELDEDDYNDALTFGVVSATHLGHPDQALTWLRREEEDSDDPLISRTWEALEAKERGPRSNGRFFYFDPETLFNLISFKYATVIQAQAKSQSDETTPEFEQFLKKHGTHLLEVLLYQAWLSVEVEAISELFGQALALKEPSGEEMVKRLAFGQDGNELLRLSAVATLMRWNIIDKEEPVTVWLNSEQRTGGISELASWLAATSGGDEDEEEDDKGYLDDEGEEDNEALEEESED